MSDLGLDTLRTVDEAIAILDALPVRVAPPRPADARRRPALAADVLADRDYPPFDKSLVDGYAARSADLATAGASLPCVGEIAAGHAWTGGAIAPGACVAIMTGAPLPRGVDCVVPVEETTSGAGQVHFATIGRAGRSIARRGSDAWAGSVVLRAGESIGAAQIAVLAQVGRLPPDLGSIPNRPTAGRLGARRDGDATLPLRAHVLTTGDEVVPHDADAVPPDAIRDANGPMLVALLAALGVAATRSHVGDDPADVREAIDRLSRGHDLLFITGGMSMGRHDHVPATLRALGFDLPITKVRIKPGKPFVVGTMAEERETGREGPSRDQSASRVSRRIVIGLPGNPVSGFCCTLRFAARVIRRMQGEPAGGDLRDAALTLPLSPNGPREFYQPAMLESLGGVTPLDWKGSADVFTLARADALIVRSVDEPARDAGATVRVLPIPR